MLKIINYSIFFCALTLPSQRLFSEENKPKLPRAESIDLKEPVQVKKPQPTLVPTTKEPENEDVAEQAHSKILLGVEVPPSTATRLSWLPADSFGDLSPDTPVLVVNGAQPGQTLCLVAAIHGDELNGVEMIRRIVYTLDPKTLKGTVIGVPIANVMAFRRNSRYLPDRRDLNRFFPGNPTGSAASRIAYSFFSQIISKCDVLVDIHTGSFHRTNLPQLRADLSIPQVAKLSEMFGSIAVLNSKGHPNSLRAAAARAGVPTVTMEAGEPLRLQDPIVIEGTKAIEALLHKMGMVRLLSFWSKPAPVYYRSVWVRADLGGFLFSRVALGASVEQGELLGRVIDPVTNIHRDIISPHKGRVLGMALDQMVQPGFATHHIGIEMPEEKLIAESKEKQQESVADEEEYLDSHLLPVESSEESSNLGRDLDE